MTVNIFREKKMIGFREWMLFMNEQKKLTEREASQVFKSSNVVLTKTVKFVRPSSKNQK